MWAKYNIKVKKWQESKKKSKKNTCRVRKRKWQSSERVAEERWSWQEKRRGRREEDREGVGPPCSFARRRAGPATSPNEHHRECVRESPELDSGVCDCVCTDISLSAGLLLSLYVLEMSVCVYEGLSSWPCVCVCPWKGQLEPYSLVNFKVWVKASADF